MKKTVRSVMIMGALGIGCLAVTRMAHGKDENLKTDGGNPAVSAEEAYPANWELPTADKTVKILGYNTTGSEYVNAEKIYSPGTPGYKDGLTYTVKEAALSHELEDEDGYYEKRGYIRDEVEMLTTRNGYVMYEEELRYLTISLSVENQEDVPESIQRHTIGGSNIREDNARFQGADVADWRCFDKSGQEVKCGDAVTIPAGETYDIELVLVIEAANIYDYHLEVCGDANAAWRNIYFDLNLALHETDGFSFITDENAESTWEQRNLAQLKVEHITNKEIAENQKEGSYVLEQYYHEASDTFGEIAEVDFGDGDVEIYSSWLCNVKDVRLKDSIEELPESFQNRTYLDDMTKVYMDKFGYDENDLQYLMITMDMEQQMDVEKMIPIDNVAQLMWLYNRDSENCLWKIGYPDDYEIEGWDTDGSEHKDHFLDKPKATHTMTAVYVIWPGALQDVYLWEPTGKAVVEGANGSYSKIDFRTDETQGGVKIQVHQK